MNYIIYIFNSYLYFFRNHYCLQFFFLFLFSYFSLRVSHHHQLQNVFFLFVFRLMAPRRRTKQNKEKVMIIMMIILEKIIIDFLYAIIVAIIIMIINYPFKKSFPLSLFHSRPSCFFHHSIHQYCVEDIQQKKFPNKKRQQLNQKKFEDDN